MVALARRIRQRRSLGRVTAMSEVDARQVARIYHEAMDRITSLVSDEGVARLDTAVAACPLWSVRDVVAHLAAVADDWGQGVLTGAPTDEQTAAQIARFDGQGVHEIIEAWTTAAAHLSHLAEDSGVGAADRRRRRPRARCPGRTWQAGRPRFRGGSVHLRSPALQSSDACAGAGDGGRRRVPQWARQRRRNRASHYTIRGVAVANRPPQSRSARGDGLVGGPGAGNRSPLHVRARRGRPRRIAEGER